MEMDWLRKRKNVQKRIIGIKYVMLLSDDRKNEKNRYAKHQKIINTKKTNIHRSILGKSTKKFFLCIVGIGETTRIIYFFDRMRM